MGGLLHVGVGGTKEETGIVKVDAGPGFPTGISRKIVKMQSSPFLKNSQQLPKINIGVFFSSGSTHPPSLIGPSLAFFWMSPLKQNIARIANAAQCHS